MSQPITTLQICTKQMKVCTQDVETLPDGKLHLYFNYVYIGTRSVHSIILGPRPIDIPDTWVIDHKDRDIYNNCRDNLRWVSRSFNAWNAEVKARNTSVFKGVYLDRAVGKWRAQVCGKHVGRFDNERDAAIASATASVRKFGDLAATSDLLVGPGLLTQDEMDTILYNIENVPVILKKPSTRTGKVAFGIYTRFGLYKVQYKGKFIASFEDKDEAIKFREEHVANVGQREWLAYKLTKPDVDEDGDVAIKLTHSSGDVKFSKVDLEFWHTLTHKRTWNLGPKGYISASINGTGVMLHRAVIDLIIPNYKPVKGKSIDHIIPSAKLDNRRKNLRIASNTLQQLNKVKRPNSKSIHKGVTRNQCNNWSGQFSYHVEGVEYTYCITKKDELEVVAALNIKRIEIHGDDAVLG